MKSLLALYAFSAFFAVKAFAAGPPNLAWNPNTEPDIANYVLHIGTNSGVYLNIVTLNAPLAVISSKLLPWFPGQTNYVVVTAVNTTGFESGFSNEISANIPANPKQLRLALESAPTPTGPWSEVSSAGFSLSAISDDTRFYRGRLSTE